VQPTAFTTLGTGKANKTDCVCDTGYVYDTAYAAANVTIDPAEGGQTCKVCGIVAASLCVGFSEVARAFSALRQHSHHWAVLGLYSDVPCRRTLPTRVALGVLYALTMGFVRSLCFCRVAQLA
jgi:hypothetical protein